MKKIPVAVAFASGISMMFLGLVLALFTWIGFGGISEADQGLSPAPLRIGFVLVFLGLGAIGFVVALISALRAVRHLVKRRAV